MKNIVISAILAATVLIAGTFVYMPIEKASTVHTGILAKQIATNSGDDTSNAALVDIVPGSSLPKSGRLCLKVTDAGATQTTNLKLSITADNDEIQLLADAQITDTDGECTNFTGFRVRLDAGGTGDTVDFVAVWSEKL